jgi:type IV pilus assembly protein PilC
VTERFEGSMDFQYVAYTSDGRLVKGRLTASNEEAAESMLDHIGCQLVSLKTITPFFDIEKLLERFTRINPREIIMFSRQLALLLESGCDIVTSLDLLKSQSTNPLLKNVIGKVTLNVRGGTLLSIALSKHPRVFPEIFHRTIAAGEQGGNLEVVLRQMADFLEKGVLTEKKIKSALTYPLMLGVVAIVVVAILVSFVMPTFASLYAAFDVELPLPTRMLLGITDWLFQYGLILLWSIIAVVAIGYIYFRTETGRYKWDKLVLRLPVVGRIFLLGELSRCCRTMALLLKVGLPLPEIMDMAIRTTNNKAMREALTEVRQELIRGQGIAKPMAKRAIFLPLMVQMAGAGEETGNLDSTLTTVAQSYEVEGDDRISIAVGLIQPAMIVAIAIVIGFVALALISSMYSIYGQVSL